MINLRVVEVNDKNNPGLIGLVPNLVFKGVVKNDHLEHIDVDEEMRMMIILVINDDDDDDDVDDDDDDYDNNADEYKNTEIKILTSPSLQWTVSLPTLIRGLSSCRNRNHSFQWKEGSVEP